MSIPSKGGWAATEPFTDLSDGTKLLDGIFFLYQLVQGLFGDVVFRKRLRKFGCWNGFARREFVWVS